MGNLRLRRGVKVIRIGPFFRIATGSIINLADRFPAGCSNEVPKLTDLPLFVRFNSVGCGGSARTGAEYSPADTQRSAPADGRADTGNRHAIYPDGK